MSIETEPNSAYVQYLLDDASSRVKYQHEFALAGMRTLILINGGAIVGLLTYAGNVLDKAGAAALGLAFLWYVAGLVCTTTAYVFAYFSQGMFVNHLGIAALMAIGLMEGQDDAKQQVEMAASKGYLCIGAAVVLTVVSLASFVVGSVMAMRALT